MQAETQQNSYFIIDFDSTFIQCEGLEELAAVVLQKNPNREKILEKIKEITDLGMEGKISFAESLKKRLKLLPITQADLAIVAKRLKKKVTPSIARNKQFFKAYKKQIYLISGGFREFILPIVSEFGIPKEHVLANQFLFDKKGNALGIDKKNPLSQKGGKVKAVKSLGLKGDIFIIGDGYTDYEIKKKLPQAKFIAFTENVFREAVTIKADYAIPNFDEFLYIYHLPQALSYPKNRMLVLLLEKVNQKAITAFEREGFAVEFFERSLTETELAEKISDVSILGIRSRSKITKNLLEKAKHLMAIGAFCIGTDQIDLSSTAERGIAVFNAPFSNTRSVVELTIGEIIALARGTFPKSANLHLGIWDKSELGSMEVRGKTLGIIGYGNIGSQLSVLAESLGMKVLFYNTSEKLALGNAIACSSMAEVLKHSDIVTIHVDGDPKNRNLIGEKEFKQMQGGVLFLNLSRGFVVEINALVAALRSGKVGGAAIDVFPLEPKGKSEPFVSPLQGLPNVILTPHVGGSTKEAQENIGTFVSHRLLEYINAGDTTLSVTMPQIHVSPLRHAHRLLHIHRNVPGVLAKINTVFAEQKINILSQHLKTNETVGYAITDVDRVYDKQVMENLHRVSGTIRLRVLY